MTQPLHSPYRPDIEPPPHRIARLPVARGYPVPWFAAWIDGVAEFRMIGPGKIREALSQQLCWICGERLGRYLTFVLGPMCGVNRVSSEPPSHTECALYAARNCPFLAKPHMVRREGYDAPREAMAGVPIYRNPGAVLLWTTREFMPFRAGKGLLFQLGQPSEIRWLANGRDATRAEVEESVRTGLPALEEIAAADGEQAVADLRRQVKRFESLLPKEMVPHG